MSDWVSGQKAPFSLGSVLRGRCPHCHRGKFYTGLLSDNRRCPECGYDFHPEAGFYLGAMMVSYLVTAMLTIPLIIALKIGGASTEALFLVPILFYAFLGMFLLRYARVLWLHLEYRMTARFDGVAHKHRDTGSTGR